MTTSSNAEAMAAMQRQQGPILEVKDLQVDFTTDSNRAVHAVRDSSFSVYPGQWVAIVGESGSGKSTSAMAVLGLLAGTGHVVGGSIKLEGEEISGFSRKQYEQLLGKKMGLVPQDPMSNLNPVWRIGTQVREALQANHMDISHEKRSALAKALAGTDVTVKTNDDETFLGSAQLQGLLDDARQALETAGVPAQRREELMTGFTQAWVPGSETRWRVADDLIKAGVDDDRAWAIAKSRVVGSTLNDRIAGLLSEAGLPEAATRARQFPHEFSGGMLQRALISIGLACRPDLLIADEPTSALDVTVQKRILDHLHTLTDSWAPPCCSSRMTWVSPPNARSISSSCTRAASWSRVRRSKCFSTPSTPTPNVLWPPPRRWPPSGSSPRRPTASTAPSSPRSWNIRSRARKCSTRANTSSPWSI